MDKINILQSLVYNMTRFYLFCIASILSQFITSDNSGLDWWIGRDLDRTMLKKLFFWYIIYTPKKKMYELFESNSKQSSA